ncbi:MAG TPA: carbonic anhydrase [Geminicoccaceae bacterium]|nr:carbonic anhydrase [Geminicoccaceae bacterium]
MSRILNEVLAANAAYAKDFGAKAELQIPPARRFAILTCMDARIDPAKLAGLAEGDAHVIRNAGGRASDDAIRSLVISYKLLGTREWFVIHHTDCGMGLFTNEIMRALLANSLEGATLGPDGWRDTGKGPGSSEGEFIDWLTFKDPAAAVLTDIRRIRTHPLVPEGIPIYGYVYDVRSGRLVEVSGAKAAAESAQRPRAAEKVGRASGKKAAPARKAAARQAGASGKAAKKAAAGKKSGGKAGRGARRPGARPAGRTSPTRRG